MTSAFIPESLPHQHHISGTQTTNGSQAATGVFYGNVTFGDTVAQARPAAPPAPPKPSTTVPFRRDEDFVERGDLLSRIDERCSQPAGRAALVGLGGVGKSQLAIEYAHHVRDRSPDTWVFWVFASNAARVQTEYKRIADKLALAGKDESTANVIGLVNQWLSGEGNGNWLMIVDNIDDVETLHTEMGGSEAVPIANLVPQSNNGAVLITSRNVDVAREMVGREQDILRLGQMEEKEAEELLRKKLTKPPDETAAGLLAALEYFPLAITQAAAYINRQPGMTTSKYMRKLHSIESKAVLLEKGLPDARRPEKAKGSLLRTWQILFEQVKAERPGAADLLAYMSFFNQQSIPVFMLHYYSDHSEDEKQLEELEEHVAILHSFSLVSMTTIDEEYGMHGLVQFATRVWLKSIEKEEEWWARFVSAMASAFPTGEYENWPTCRALLPHVQSVVKKHPSNREQSEAWIKILTNAGWYAWRQGLLPQAEELLKTSLEKCEQVFDMKDNKTFLNVGLLASLLQYQGKYKESEAMNRRALAGKQEKLGKDHPATLTSVSNLALVLLYQGKYEESEAMNRRALAGYEEKLGKDHPDTLTSVSNLALVLLYQGKYEESEAMNRRALAGYEEKLGKDPRDTLTSVGNLAAVLRCQGKYEESEAMNRRALAWREEKLGKGHPDTLGSVYRYADLLASLRRYDEAQLMYGRACEGYESQLGESHPTTIACKQGFANMLSLIQRGE